MIKTLYVGISFPPKRDPECIQTSRILKYLSAFENIELDVITARPPVLNMPVDDSLASSDILIRHLYEKKLRENRYTNFLKGKIGTAFPDYKYSFFDSIVSYAGQNDVRRPDIIYTRGYPISSVIAGYELSLHFDVPLMVHFSDPWLLSPIHSYTQKLAGRIIKKEESILKKASAVTFTSLKTVERYTEYYPQYCDKFYLQPNVYDDDQVTQQISDKGCNNKLRLVYTGGIIGTRNPAPLFEAIKKLSPEEIEMLEFLIAGEADRSNRQMLSSNSLSDAVKYLGPLSLSDALELQTSADVLVLFDNIFENEKDAIYMPSKLLDYMVQQKKILAITTKGGTTDQLVNDEEIGISFGHQEVEEIAAFLRKALYEWRHGNHSFFSIKAVPKAYSASENAKFVADLLAKHAKSHGSYRHSP